MLFVRAYPRKTQEMVFDAHDRAFALFKGTCSRGIYDNKKTAVETIFVGKIGAQAVTSLALALHETKTNAAKYRELSKPDGVIRVKWQELNSDLHLEWQETGGPLVSKPQAHGFGSILTERSITDQLGERLSMIGTRAVSS
jgi:two-component sensor histidine kinase